MGASSLRLHATAIALEGTGVLLRGPSGSGKSDLALRLIDAGRARLISDDQTVLSVHEGRLIAAAPEAISGRLEVRGLGIVTCEPAPPTQVRLAVDLMPASSIERMPEPRSFIESVLDIEIARISLDPSLPGAVARLSAALGHLVPRDETGPLGLVGNGKR